MDVIRHGTLRRRRAIAAVVTALVLAALAGRACRAAEQQQNDTLRIGEARNLPDGTQVTLAGKTVTRAFGDRYYVAEPDRSAGIAVLLPRSHAPGTLVDVQGTLSNVSGETVITAASDSVKGEGPPLAPVGVSNKDSSRKSAEGQLVRVWGRVVQIGFGSAFRIDDGTALEAGGTFGLRVYKKAPFASPPEGSFVSVTGVRGQITGAFGNMPVVYVSSADDVTVID